ncbi:protein of unknown function [Pararobbsia alpina]
MSLLNSDTKHLAEWMQGARGYPHYAAATLATLQHTYLARERCPDSQRYAFIPLRRDNYRSVRIFSASGLVDAVATDPIATAV